MAKSKNSKPTHFLDNSKEFQFLNINSQIPVYDHSNVTAIISKIFMDNKPRVNYCTLRDQQTVHEKYVSPDFEVDSNTIFNEKKEHWENTNKTLAKGYSSSREVDDVLSSFVVFLAGLMIRAMSFQMNAFISFFTFPVWLMYYSFMFVFDPLRILKWVQNRTLGVFFAGWYCFCESVSLHLKGQKSILKLVVRFCWGFFWSAYVCFLLFGLLVLGFVIGGVTMCYLVEEPIHITENLNFDYTKSNPVALVPIMSCPSISCGLNCKENIELEKYVGSRVIAPNQNLNLDISLKLPESDYNQKLGVFQVYTFASP
ncbi:hypothetical protein IFM89_000238 [Coptis chinensis]|uniref:Seipin n=1 Tax=Coptis chinensis TaxID=261450 RepID=A0A835IKT4_9MAGN|nr:hypothetical protein IFM89_000238 [Coptis chinensis]